MERIRLVVLFGGQSAEHEISLVTARHVLAACDLDRYDVEPVAITRSGRWVIAQDAAQALASGGHALPDALVAEGPEVDPIPLLTSQGEQVVVLPLLHGPLGEDGTVQGLLELTGVPYVGCGVLASALAMDKAMAKELFAADGLPQARHRALHERHLTDRVLDELIDQLGLPLFVKPANMGSSVGVSKAKDREGLWEALHVAARYDEWLVVEEAVDGRELECGVLGNLEPRASVVGEIVPGAEFYDYDDKYRDGLAHIVIPAALPEPVAEEARRLALQAFAALRCEGMARVDFFYEEGGRGLLLNEVNTIPGFTPISMYPKLWEASGVPYHRLIDELIQLALERYARRAAKRRTS
ncbi:MAG: D-alanine--D-alanine ligase family protein [Acidimicrobiales bacterium]